MEGSEERKRPKKVVPSFRGNLALVDEETPEENFAGEGRGFATAHVQSFNPQTMEKSLFQQFEGQLRRAEEDSQRKTREKMAAERAKMQGQLEALEEKLEQTRDGTKREILGSKIQLLEKRLAEIRKEENAERELEQMVEEQERQENPEKESMISAGLITPFEDVVSENPAVEAEFHVMMRKGVFVDDTDDQVFARRIRAWQTGQDLMAEKDMIDTHVGEVEEMEVLNRLKQAKKKQGEEDEEDDGDFDQDDENEEMDSVNLAGSDDAELVFSGDDEEVLVEPGSSSSSRIEPQGPCDECLRQRGMKQVLEVLGKERPEDLSFDVSFLLKNCRGNSQGALEVILTTEEKELQSLYPRRAACIHFAFAEDSSRQRRQAPPAPPMVNMVTKKKRTVPEPIPLPSDVIDNLNAGQLASVVIDHDFRMPLETYDCLFEYQRTGVRWMWELHKQQVGGILADEMGLGKTVQVISFLYGLLHSHMLSAPTLLICPATVMKQWVAEFHKWAPPFRVMMLHSSTRTVGEMTYSREMGLMRAISARGGGVVVTTFEGFRRNKAALLPVKWGYAVLDEGHKIRNPDADISLTAKQLQTHRRLILSGTPIQNSLKELWSLMDFVYPGKLGTLPIFQREFEIPIQMGGYATATPSQVMTAFRCSVMLRDLIKPFLLRRLKVDVDVSLPDKTEQVLMCRLTAEQVKAYRSWIYSDEVKRILDGKLNALYGISFLRKICNHPDLLKLENVMTPAEEQEFGNFERSGKMLVLHEMLPVWKAEGHRVLIFSQGVQMLNVICKYLKQQGHSHLRMDGTTSVQSRIPMIDRFNEDPSIFVFVLTTRVGGIGVNLTGADRVVIFDPDWNPSTDMQARERAWRIGQKRKVCIYRLVTVGTIEEKVLQRQIYKTFLTQKVLSNPRQRRFFSGRDMADLFTLGSEYSSANMAAAAAAKQGANAGDGDPEEALGNWGSSSETSKIFHDMRHKVEIKAAPAAPSKSGDAREDEVLLRTLLGKNERVASALNHEAMVGEQPSEYVILVQEADLVAQRAAAKVLESSQRAREAPIHVPTWTGKRGEAGIAPRFGQTLAALRSGEGVIRSVNAIEGSGGAPGSAANNGVGQARVLVFDSKMSSSSSQKRAAGGIVGGSVPASSGELLKSIKRRKNGVDEVLDDAGPRKTEEEVRGERLLTDLINFIWGNGGRVESDELVLQFRNRLETPEDKFSFRAMLREVADFDKGEWVLKKKYQV